MRLAEKMWAILKRNFTNQFFKTLDQIRDFIESQVNQLTEKMIVSACSYPYIFECLNWTI